MFYRNLSAARLARLTRLLRVSIGLAIIAASLLLIDWRAVVPSLGAAFSKVISRQALAVACLCQIIALSTCAVGLKVLAARLTLPASALSRWVRDAIGAVPIGFPGMGEAASIRVLSLFGVPATEAVAITTADVFAETLAQAAYALVAVLLAPSSLKIAQPVISLPLAPALVGGGAAAVVSAILLRLSPPGWKEAVNAFVRQTVGLVRTGRFRTSLALHSVAWGLGGLQLYFLSQILGAHLSLLQSFSLEGLVFALRAVFFFVPAGVGVQEAGLGAVGAAFGLAPIDAIALALLLRLRDVVVLSPALLAWAGWELRRALRRPASRRSKEVALSSCA